jgi:hypothetical protein
VIPDQLKARILHYIRNSGDSRDDTAFNQLLLELHAAQRAASPFIEKYYRAAQPKDPQHWSEVPGLPTSAFKRTQVRCFPEQNTRAFFQTSGTTEGESGRHYFETLEFYEAAILPNFKAHLLPDLERMTMLMLMPPPAEASHSSLVHMMHVVSEAFGEPIAAGTKAEYFLKNNKLEFEQLLDRLRQHGAGQPVFLLGTAFAFVYFLDALAASGQHLDLPAGSRIMETGGFKGRTREIARSEFYRMLSGATGVPEFRVVNEYGMTELSSQFYDVSLASGVGTVRKSMPHWTRVLCIDPATNATVPDGSTGLLRIYDLANVGSACVLQTEDVGVKHGETFEVHGRVSSAGVRGCSLDAEHLITPR